MAKRQAISHRASGPQAGRGELHANTGRGGEDLYSVTPGVEERDGRAPTILKVSPAMSGTNSPSSFGQRTATFATPFPPVTHAPMSIDTASSAAPVTTTNSTPRQACGRSAATGSSRTQTTANTTPVPFGHRLNVWFKMCDIDGRRIVGLSTAMTVHEVYAAVRLAFGRELEGRAVARLSFTLPADVFDEPIVVVCDDEGTWGALLEMLCAESRLPGLRGEIQV